MCGVHQSADLAGMERQVILAEGVNDVIASGLDYLGKVPFRVMADEPIAEIGNTQFHTHTAAPFHATRR